MNPVEWTNCRLGEIAEIVMGQSPSGDTCNNGGIGVPLLNGPTEFGSHSPSPVQYTSDPKKKSKKNDILFCVRGSTTGRMNWSDQEFAIGRGLAAIRSRTSTDLQYFIKGIIDHNLNRILGASTGSTFPNVSRDQLNNLEIFIPTSKDEQFRIASILSSLDDKIELNLQMNKTLEDIAQAIFKEWFVDFRFPGFDGELVNGLPMGWKKGVLSDIVKCVKKPIKPDLRDKYDFYLPIDCIGQKTMTLTNSNSINIANSSLIEFLENDILFGAMRSYFHKVIVAPFDGLTRSTCFVFRPIKPDYLAYVYMLCYQEDSVKYSSQTAKGTTMPYAIWEGGMDGMPVIIPDANACREFHKVVFPIFEKIKMTFFLNTYLKETRDYLLPKLITGTIRVA